MGDVWCFTSASLSYLDRVRVLGRTLRRRHPDWTFCLCLADRLPGGCTLDAAQEPFDRVVSIEDLGIPDFRRWLFTHDLVELCTAVKGPMLQRLLDQGARKVVYLDPDIAVLGDLHEVEELLDGHDVLLTPHLLEPEPTLAGVLDNEICALRHGIYNLGFLAVANSGEGRRFARWWAERLLAFCVDDVPRGLFTDQRWCDHAPVFFPTLRVLRDPGYNVASWNVAQRPVTIEQDGSIRAGGRPLRFFHFTKIDNVGHLALERNGRDQRALFELITWYLAQLDANAAPEIPGDWWAYGRYADGRAIPRRHRLAYRDSPVLQERFADPFAAGAGSLREVLEQDVPLEAPAALRTPARQV